MYNLYYYTEDIINIPVEELRKLLSEYNSVDVTSKLYHLVPAYVSGIHNEPLIMITDDVYKAIEFMNRFIIRVLILVDCDIDGQLYPTDETYIDDELEDFYMITSDDDKSISSLVSDRYDEISKDDTVLRSDTTSRTNKLYLIDCNIKPSSNIYFPSLYTLGYRHNVVSLFNVEEDTIVIDGLRIQTMNVREVQDIILHSYIHDISGYYSFTQLSGIRSLEVSYNIMNNIMSGMMRSLEELRDIHSDRPWQMIHDTRSEEFRWLDDVERLKLNISHDIDPDRSSVSLDTMILAVNESLIEFRRLKSLSLHVDVDGVEYMLCNSYREKLEELHLTYHYHSNRLSGGCQYMVETYPNLRSLSMDGYDLGVIDIINSKYGYISELSLINPYMIIMTKIDYSRLQKLTFDCKGGRIPDMGNLSQLKHLTLINVNNGTGRNRQDSYTMPSSPEIPGIPTGISSLHIQSFSGDIREFIVSLPYLTELTLLNPLGNDYNILDYIRNEYRLSSLTYDCAGMLAPELFTLIGLSHLRLINMTIRSIEDIQYGYIPVDTILSNLIIDMPCNEILELMNDEVIQSNHRLLYGILDGIGREYQR